MTTKTETTNTQIPSDAVLVFYALRHEKSLMNLLGYGEADSPLADAGRRDVPNLARVVWHIGVENIDAIISGTLSRHVETTEGIVSASGYMGQVIPESNMNAVIEGPLIEEPDKTVIEARYRLDRFAPDKDGLYHAELEGERFSFDPVLEQIFPFGLYSSAFVDRRLRTLAFPDGGSLASFDELKNPVFGLNQMLREKVRAAGKPQIFVGVSSCSVLGPQAEYAVHCTVGERMIPFLRGGPPYTDEQIAAYRQQRHPERFYPQDHGEVSIFYLTAQDLKTDNPLRLFKSRLTVDELTGGNYVLSTK